MGTLNSAYTGQHSDAAPLSVMPQQQQAPQVLANTSCDHRVVLATQWHGKPHSHQAFDEVTGFALLPGVAAAYPACICSVPSMEAALPASVFQSMLSAQSDMRACLAARRPSAAGWTRSAPAAGMQVSWRGRRSTSTSNSNTSSSSTAGSGRTTARCRRPLPTSNVRAGPAFSGVWVLLRWL